MISGNSSLKIQYWWYWRHSYPKSNRDTPEGICMYMKRLMTVDEAIEMCSDRSDCVPIFGYFSRNKAWSWISFVTNNVCPAIARTDTLNCIYKILSWSLWIWWNKQNLLMVKIILFFYKILYSTWYKNKNNKTMSLDDNSHTINNTTKNLQVRVAVTVV